MEFSKLCLFDVNRQIIKTHTNAVYQVILETFGLYKNANSFVC